MSVCPDYAYFPYAKSSVTLIPNLPIELDWSKLICDYGFDPEYEHTAGSYVSSFKYRVPMDIFFGAF